MYWSQLQIAQYDRVLQILIKSGHCSSDSLTVLEASRTLPPYPTTFTKPAHSAADHGDDIEIPKWVSKKLDYEGELALIIGKDCKNVKEDEALDVVGGYTATNDVSARDWQRDPELAGKVPQWNFGKSVDKFAPLGPVLVAAHVLHGADSLELKTYVNHELRQQGNTSGKHADGEYRKLLLRDSLVNYQSIAQNWLFPRHVLIFRPSV